MYLWGMLCTLCLLSYSVTATEGIQVCVVASCCMSDVTFCRARLFPFVVDFLFFFFHALACLHYCREGHLPAFHRCNSLYFVFLNTLSQHNKSQQNKHTQTHTHARTHARSHARTLSLSLSLSLSLTPTHTHTHTHLHTHTHTHTSLPKQSLD